MIAAFRDGMGLDIHDGYGQTETGALTGALTEGEVRDGSMGLPLPGIELRIEDGELLLKTASCPTFFSHYIGPSPTPRSGGGPATSSAPTRTATSGSRAAATT